MCLILDKCSAYCAICTNGKPSCKPKCSDNTKYFECQSTCVEASGKGPKNCIEDKNCLQKCDNGCKKHWQG